MVCRIARGSAVLRFESTLVSMIASRRRSSCAASLLTSKTHVTSANRATTAAAASAAAIATRVRSDIDLRRTSVSRFTAPRPASRLHPEHISNPANRVDHPRDVFAFELAPQVTDEDVGDVCVGVEVVPPDKLEQPLPGQHHPSVL